MKHALHIGAHEELIHEYFLKMSEDWIFDYVLHTHNPKHKFQHQEVFNGRIYVVTPYASSKIQNFYEIAKIIYRNRRRYQVIHAHGGRSHLILLLFSRFFSNAKIIAHAHTVGILRKSWIRNFINKFCGLLFSLSCHHLLACSEEAGTYLFGHSRAEFFKNIINYEKFRIDRNQTVEEPRVIMMADYTEAKNHLFAVQVIHETVKSGETQFFVDMYGENKGTKNAVMDSIRHLGLDFMISVNERTPHPEKAFAKADILLMPSTYEGFGMVAVEGQASNLKCLVSDALPEVVKISTEIQFISLNSKDYWSLSLREAIENIKNSPSRNYPISDNYDSAVFGDGLRLIYEGNHA